jgi:hypothetical protein
MANPNSKNDESEWNSFENSVLRFLNFFRISTFGFRIFVTVLFALMDNGSKYIGQLRSFLNQNIPILLKRRIITSFD